MEKNVNRENAWNCGYLHHCVCQNSFPESFLCTILNLVTFISIIRWTNWSRVWALGTFDSNNSCHQQREQLKYGKCRHYTLTGHWKIKGLKGNVEYTPRPALANGTSHNTTCHYQTLLSHYHVIGVDTYFNKSKTIHFQKFAFDVLPHDLKHRIYFGADFLLNRL